MTFNDAIIEIGELLEVDDTQYSTDARTRHINEALSLLSREYETRLNEAIVDLQWDAGRTDYPLSDIGNTELQAEAVDGVIWINPEDQNRVVTGEDISQVFTTFGDASGSPEAASSPASYTLYESKLHLRPVPSADVIVRVPIHGTPKWISTGTNKWLTLVPYAVVYRACEIGALWTGQEARVQFFKSMRMEHMEMFNNADSSKYDTPMVSEEPG